MRKVVVVLDWFFVIAVGLLLTGVAAAFVIALIRWALTVDVLK